MKTTFRATATASRIFCLLGLVFASSDSPPAISCAISFTLSHIHIYTYTHIFSPSLSLFLLIQHSRGGTRCLLSSLVELELEVYAWCPSGGLRLYILSVSVLFLCLRLYYAMVHSGLTYEISDLHTQQFYRSQLACRKFPS